MDEMNQIEEGDGGDNIPAWREVFLYFLFLGFVNIGGPVAQITMMFNHMVEKRQWLSKDRFIKIMAFCHMLPGPEALQLAIYVGYLKRKLWGGILAGLTFILPGAVVMIVLSWLYVRYGKLPQVMDALYVLKPAVLGIIAAGIIKLGRAAIRNIFLALLLVGAFVGMHFGGINFLLILVIAGALNLLIEEGWPRSKKTARTLPLTIEAFLAGVSAAVVGVIAVVSLDLVPEAIVGWPSVAIAVIAFLLIVWLKRDVALVAIGAIAGGVIYSLVRAFT